MLHEELQDEESLQRWIDAMWRFTQAREVELGSRHLAVEFVLSSLQIWLVANARWAKFCAFAASLVAMEVGQTILLDWEHLDLVLLALWDYAFYPVPEASALDALADLMQERSRVHHAMASLAL